MKIRICSLALLTALTDAALTALFAAPTMTITFKRKGGAKTADVPNGPSPSAVAWAAGSKSTAIPFAKAPATLDGSMLGDVGFDPLGFSTAPIGAWFANIDLDIGEQGNLVWYREAELMHGRIAQLAFVGVLFPYFVGTLPGNKWTGIEAYSNYKYPLEALSQAPKLAILQIFLFMSWLEFKRIEFIREEGIDYVPGDMRIGQGQGRWNPLGFTFTPEEYLEKQLQELKHCRLAMIAIFLLWVQIQRNDGLLDAKELISFTDSEEFRQLLKLTNDFLLDVKVYFQTLT